MPYKVFPEDDAFVVYKVDEQENAVGDALGTHEQEAEADAQIAALYAAESDAVTEAVGDVPTDETSLPEGDDEPSTPPGEEPQTVAETTQSKTAIRENAEHVLTGAFPNVPIAQGVDFDAIKAHDPDPMFLTLELAEVGRTSENGLVYDEALVSELERQLPGLAGIRGHISDEELSTAYPVPDIYWVGAKREGSKLYGKGYIPPGATREDVRIKKATGGRIGSSIFAHVIQEMDGENAGRWYAREPEFEQVDFASPQRAALRMSGDFALTREMTNPEHKEDTMTTITLKELPQELKDQVLAEYREKNHVAEMQTELNRAKQRIKEMGDVTAHVKLNIPDGADPMERIQALTEFLAALQSQFGEDVSVEMLTNMQQEAEALQAEVEAMDEEQYAAQVDAAVAELTKEWNVTTADGRAKLATLHSMVKTFVAVEMTGKGRDRDLMKATVQKVWDEKAKPFAEMTRDQISGGTVLPASNARRTNQGLATPEEIRAARERVGI